MRAYAGLVWPPSLESDVRGTRTNSSAPRTKSPFWIVAGIGSASGSVWPPAPHIEEKR